MILPQEAQTVTVVVLVIHQWKLRMDALLQSRPVLVQRLFWVSLVMTLLFVAGSYINKALDNRSAFLRWRQQVLQVDSPTDIYREFQYPNPPIMALILRPLASVEPPLAGALAWFGLKVGMAALSLVMIVRLIEHGGVPFPPWARAVAVLLVLRPIIGDLTHGNVNILILFLVTASLYAFHRSRDFSAGVLLALAISCKVTPLLFVPYFAWKRQWKVLLGTGVGLALFLFAVPSLFLGWNDNLSKLNSWTQQMVVPFLRDGIVSSEHPNQSLPGVVHRLLARSPSFSAYPNGVYTPTEYHNLTEISPASARWIIRTAQALFMLGLVVLCRSRDRGGWQLAAEFAYVLVGMLIFSERTWKHHCVTLALPIAVLVYALATLPVRRRPLIAALAVALGLMFCASSLFGKRGADLAQVYGVYLWAFLVLLAALAGVLCWACYGERRSMTQLPSISR